MIVLTIYRCMYDVNFLNRISVNGHGTQKTIWPSIPQKTAPTAEWENSTAVDKLSQLVTI